MSRLLATLLVCLALQSAAPAAAFAHQPATIGVDHGGGGGARVVLPAPDAHAWCVVAPRLDGLPAPSFVTADARTPGAPVAVARLWLRGARLLC
jgi:hypothetical protein